MASRTLATRPLVSQRAPSHDGAPLSVISLPGHAQHQDPHHPWQRKPPPRPHCGESPGGERTEGTSETPAPAPAGIWTSATTNCKNSGASGTAPSTPEDPQSLNSPTTTQAEDERRERLGTGRTSSEPEADPETQEPPARRTDAQCRTVAASTTGGTGPHTAGGSAATPAPSTAGTRGEDAGPGSAAEDV
ncbi:mucin-1-like [Procambarus clarkii]|uniref:mucin-1-like n=1 Tax=Procambarus clarkii TaxID=6728 RepID=UPI0037432068